MKALFLPLVAALAAALPLALATSNQDSRPTDRAPLEPVTVIALRHAEKQSDGSRDPALSEAGEARAAALAELLSKAGVTHIFSTPYERTRATVAPLARALELELIEYSPADLGGLGQQLESLPPGSVALVCGHSNTTPALVLALGGEIAELGTYRGAPALGETEYGRLFVLTLGGAGQATKTLELRY